MQTSTTAATAKPFDFSDAREVLLDTRAREERAATALGHELAWDADWLALLDWREVTVDEVLAS